MKPAKNSTSIGLKLVRAALLVGIVTLLLFSVASTLPELYRSRTVGVAALVLFQTLLIAGLLVQRSRRAKAEESLRLSEEKFSKAFLSIPDALVISRQSDR
jgi:hypothetical protein